MLTFLRKLLTGYRAGMILLLVYAFLMALATIVEKFYGTESSKIIIYYSPLFFLVQLLILLNIVGVSIKRWHHLRQTSYLWIHYPMIIILLGATVTHFWSEEGLMHIREGETSRAVYAPKTGDKVMELPFEISLERFVLTRYPGSGSPSSYESYLRIHHPSRGEWQEKVFMNNVLDLDGYRFFQSSYDPDEQGTILSVSYDRVGRTITYLGYSLLTLALIFNLFRPGGRSRRLLRRIHRLSLYLLPLICTLSASAQPAVSPDHLQRVRLLPVLDSHGRVVPFSTFARTIVHKLTREETVDERSPEEFLVSILTVPSAWVDKPIILQDSKELHKLYGLEEGYISYRDAFDCNGNYRFSSEVEAAYSKSPQERTSVDKSLMKLDERVNLCHRLLNYQLLKLFPVPEDAPLNRWMAPGDDLSIITPMDSATVVTLMRDYIQSVHSAYASGQWGDADRALEAIQDYQDRNASPGMIQPRLLRAEVVYNQLDLIHYCKRIYLIGGGLLLLLSLYILGTERRESKKLLGRIRLPLFLIIILGMVGHLVSIALRWYVSGRAPWSNSYETMVCLSFAIVLIGALFVRRDRIVPAVGSLLGGVILFVSGLSSMDPQITPLVPVLKSPWLMFHVATLIVGYGFFALSAMVGTIDLLLMSLCTEKSKEGIGVKVTQLTAINELSLILGLTFSLIGIMLGAVWANESWGRYWSWDPKETWALITVVLYAAILHYRWLGRVGILVFNFLSQLVILSVGMTYFGVNYFLSGMHSYGSGDLLRDVPLWIYSVVVIFFCFPILLAWRKRKLIREFILAE